MLKCLRIQHLAIIEHLELDFSGGLTILTGETGAGKSILIQSLGLVLGAKAKSDMVRTGESKATIEALFEPNPDDPIWQSLADLDIDPADGELLIRRTLTNNGRSRVTLNGQLVTLAQLRTMADNLVDVSSQHAHHTLVNPSNHRQLLDAFAGTHDDVERTALLVDKALAARRDIRQAEAAIKRHADQVDMIRFQLEELDAAAPSLGEWDALEQRATRLRHGADLAHGTEAAAYALDGRHNPPAICSELAKIMHDVAVAAETDPSLRPLHDQIDSALIELRDVADALDEYGRNLEHNPDELHTIEDRLQLLRRLVRRYGNGLNDPLEKVVQRHDELREQLALVEGGQGNLTSLHQEAKRCLQAATTQAERLSHKRKVAARRLGREITRELADLGMGNAIVDVEVAPGKSIKETNESRLSVAGVPLTRHGLDHVELCIAPNPGEAPRPLAQIASGGELSRALLAIKRVLAGQGTVSMYVFDEVDSGVGGAIAERIGAKIDQVAAHHQVLCITHQPAIAAFADQHLYVKKAVVDGRTASSVRALTTEERVEEIARMMGGRTVTDKTKAAAAELLAQAGGVSNSLDA